MRVIDRGDGSGRRPDRQILAGIDPRPSAMRGWTMILWQMLDLDIHLVGGGVIGAAYFRTLLHDIRQLDRAGPQQMAMLRTTGRFAAITALLVLTSREGVPQLATATAGLLLGGAVSILRDR